jgi:hypothetical protein
MLVDVPVLCDGRTGSVLPGINLFGAVLTEGGNLLRPICA